MQWHQLDHTQTICTSLLTDNNINTSSLNLDALPDATLKTNLSVLHVYIIVIISQ